jgi:hypothetical protein
MADRKISELTDNPNPGATTGIVPIIESSGSGQSVTYSQYRTTVKNLVQAGVKADQTTEVDGGNF